MRLCGDVHVCHQECFVVSVEEHATGALQIQSSVEKALVLAVNQNHPNTLNAFFNNNSIRPVFS